MSTRGSIFGWLRHSPLAMCLLALVGQFVLPHLHHLEDAGDDHAVEAVLAAPAGSVPAAGATLWAHDAPVVRGPGHHHDDQTCPVCLVSTQLRQGWSYTALLSPVLAPRPTARIATPPRVTAPVRPILLGCLARAPPASA